MEFPLEHNATQPFKAIEASVDFDKMPDGLVPAIVQDHRTGVVLMLGYVNADALRKTRETGLVTFFSRSRQRLWTKGESSGHVLRLVEWRTDCDSDAILIKAAPSGPVCHTGDDTCWGERNQSARFLNELQHIIRERRGAAAESSYTARLFSEGIAKIAQKVGEEAVETVIEAMGDHRERLLNESADLLYHLMVLLEAKGTGLDEVENVLKSRHTK